MDKNKKLMIGAGVGVAVLLCALCAIVGIGGYVYQDELMTMLGLAQPKNVVEMLPQDTDMYMVITPNIQNQAGYQNLKNLYLDNPKIQTLLDEFWADLSDQTEITYEADIKPWIGTEVVMAVTDLAESVDNPSATPPVVIAAATIDKEASDQFIAKVLDGAIQDGTEFSTESYKGVTLHIDKSDEEEPAMLSTFNNFVVFANSESLIKGMIDRIQDEELSSLADNATFQKITNALPPESVATFYMGFSELLEAASQQGDIQLAPEQLQTLKAYEAVGIATILQPNGVEVDFVISYDLESFPETMRELILNYPASPNTIHNDIPADALFVINATGLDKAWQQSKMSLEENPDFAETLADMQQELGIDLDQDVFSWMTAEYAFVLLEVPAADEFTPPLGGYVLIGTDNIEAAQQGIQNISDALDQTGSLPPLEQQTVAGIDMQVMPDFMTGEMSAGYGFYNNYFTMAYLPASVEALTSAPQNSLTNSPHFQAVKSRLPGNNYGYVYVDLEHTQALIEDQLDDFTRPDYDESVQPFVEPMLAVGLAGDSESIGQGISKGTVFFLMTEADK